MKNTIFLIALVAFFSQCSEEPTTPTPNPGSNTNSSITGAWTLDNVIQENGSVKWDNVLIATYTGESSNEVGTAQFNSDGTFTTVTSYDFTATFDQGGTTQSQTNSIPETTVTGTYDYNSSTKKLTITNNGNTATADVLELTANKFVYRLSVKQVQVTQGVSVESSNETTTTYTR